MSAYVLPNIILFAAVLVLLFLVARKLPQAEKQLAEGLAVPTNGIDRGRILLVLKGKLRSLWQFILEAKGLRDPLGSRLRMQQLLRVNKKTTRAKTAAIKISASHQVKAATSPAPVARPTSKRAKPMVSAQAEQAEQVKQTAAPSQTEQVVPVPVSPKSDFVGAAPVVVSTDVTALAAQVEQSMELAKGYLDRKQFFEARKLLESLGQEAYGNAVYWARLGYAQYNLRVYSEAIRCYEKSLALDSSQSSRYYNLALAYEASGNRNRALANLEKAMRMSADNPKFAQTYQALKV